MLTKMSFSCLLHPRGTTSPGHREGPSDDATYMTYTVTGVLSMGDPHRLLPGALAEN